VLPYGVIINNNSNNYWYVSEIDILIVDMHRWADSRLALHGLN